jgi:hypothetical protein
MMRLDPECRDRLVVERTERRQRLRHVLQQLGAGSFSQAKPRRVRAGRMPEAGFTSLNVDLQDLAGHGSLSIAGSSSPTVYPNTT